MFCQHFKGNYYRILGEAFDTATEEMVIIYIPLYENQYKFFTRPKDEFFEVIQRDGQTMERFKAVDEKNLPESAKAFVVK